MTPFNAQHAKGITQMVTELFADTASGFTLDPCSMELERPSPAFFYSLANYERTFSVSPTQEDVSLWLMEVWVLLSRQGAYIGGWKYEGKYYLDVSLKETNRNRAVILGVSNNQIAIFDMLKQEEIFLIPERKVS